MVKLLQFLHVYNITVCNTPRLKMFGTGGLCLSSKMRNYVPEDTNEEGRVATPTSISIFDSYDMKILWCKFGHDIFSGFKMASPQIWDARFSAILRIEIEDL